jgi:hypothetical protein
MRIRLTLMLAALLLGGCAALDRHPVTDAGAAALPREWARIAEPEDLGRLEAVDEAWRSALGGVRTAGFGRALDEEGDLLDPRAALPRAEPPSGSYRCRTVKLGGVRPFVAHAPFFCHVADAGPLLALTKQTGSERPGGYLYPVPGKARLVVLGTLVLGAERSLLPYGEDCRRDMIGLVERVAPFRWRLALPWPRSGAMLEVMELTPALP